MTIGERIKELRAEAGMLQSELGKVIGFSGQVVSNVERGYSYPSTEFVNRCAAYSEEAFSNTALLIRPESLVFQKK